MQNRMKTHALTADQIDALLVRASVGRLATQSPEGYPYVVPIHFVYINEKIYTHGLPKGQKLDYIARNPKIGFEVDEMIGLLSEGVDIACNVNTEFKSVIILGEAKLLTDWQHKKEVLTKVVDKYTPQLSGRELPDNMIRGTAVLEITVLNCTGKYYEE